MKIEIDGAFEFVMMSVMGGLVLFLAFLMGQSWRSNRAYCEAACYPADPVACERDFAVCWNDERIHKIPRHK